MVTGLSGVLGAHQPEHAVVQPNTEQELAPTQLLNMEAKTAKEKIKKYKSATQIHVQVFNLA